MARKSEFEFKPLRYFEGGDRIWGQAQQIWVILVGLVTSARINQTKGESARLTYGDLAEAMGKPRQAGRTLTRQLWMIGEYCRFNEIPTLNSIVVNKETRLPGHDVVLTTGNSNVQKELADVAKFNWAAVRVPTASTFRDVWEQISQSEI